MLGKVYVVVGFGVLQYGVIVFVGELVSVVVVFWKNEGGQICELCVELLEVDFVSFIWWVSVVDVGSDVDFFIFEGIDCIIVLFEGGGFMLYSEGWQVYDLVYCFVFYDFFGE